MFREFFSSGDMGGRLDARAELMRRLHSAWLTRALRHGGKSPRIPTRPVCQGGFAPVLATPEGQRWAQEFWENALNADQELS